MVLKNGWSKVITGKLEILQGNEREIATIKGGLQVISLKDGTVINFDNLIDATGSKRHVASLLKTQSNDKYHIEYTADLPQTDHTENAIIYFNAPVKENVFKTPENISNNYYLSDFSENNWKKDGPPIIIFVQVSKNKEFIC